MPPLIFICIDWITEDELRGKKREPQNGIAGVPPAPVTAGIWVPEAAAPKWFVCPLKNHENVAKSTVELNGRSTITDSFF